MPEIVGTKEPFSVKQQNIVTKCDRLLKRAGLPTYSYVEEQLAMVSVACLESVQIGKQLVNQVAALKRDGKKVLEITREGVIPMKK